MKLSEFQKRMEQINRWAHHGCGNHGCAIEQPKGMGTNAGCSCLPRAFSEVLLNLAADVAGPNKYSRFDKET